MDELRTQYDELMARAGGLRYGRESVAVLRQAARVAHELDDLDLEYVANGLVCQHAGLSADHEMFLTTFSWCLARHDEYPDRFPALGGGGHLNLLWHYKWAIPALASMSTMPLGRIEAAMDDMTRRYEAAGAGPGGLLSTRRKMEGMLGRYDEEEATLAELKVTARDRLSDCGACLTGGHVFFFTKLGRDAEGVAALDDMLAGRAACHTEPEDAVGAALVPLLRVGRPDDAKRLYRRWFPVAMSHEDVMTVIGGYLEFLAVSGNESRALNILSANVDEIFRDSVGELSRMDSLATCAVVCDVVSAVGHGDEAFDVPPGGAWARATGRDDGWTVAGVGAMARQLAGELAVAFDRRNGNDATSRRLARTLARAQERYDLPLDARPFRPPTPGLDVPADPASRLERARNLASTEDWAGALAEASAIGGDASPEIAERARMLETFCSWGQDRPDSAAASHARRVALVRSLGREAAADALERLGLAVLARDAADEAVIDAEIARLEASAAPTEVLAMAYVLRATVLGRAERWDEQATAADTAIGLLRDRPDDADLADALWQRVVAGLSRDEDPEAVRPLVGELLRRDDIHASRRWWCLTILARLDGGARDFESGAERADEAVAVAAAAGLRDAVVQAAGLAGDLWSDAGRPAEAVVRYRFGVHQAELGEQPNPRLEVALAGALSDAGELVQSEEILGELSARTDELPPGLAMHIWRLRAQVAEARRLTMSARGMWTRARSLALAAGEPATASGCALREGHLARDLDDPTEALQAYEAAVEIARAVEGAHRTDAVAWAEYDAIITLALHQSRLHDDAALTTLDEASGIAEEQNSDPARGNVVAVTASVLSNLGRTEDAVRTALEAADLLRAADAPGPAGGSEYLAGRLLLELGRPQEAVPVLRSALAAPELQAGFLSAVRVTLADALEASGHRDEAERLRREAELPPDAPRGRDAPRPEPKHG